MKRNMDRPSSSEIDEIYCLELLRRPWGDYGRILFDGTCSLRESDGHVELDRTGPFVPSISFPGSGVIVVTDSTKNSMEHLLLKGVAFRPVIKRKIVEMRWEDWDQNTFLPLICPASGEPEDYLRENKHSPKVSSAIGSLWQVVMEHSAKVVRRSSGRGRINFEYVPGSWNGNDIFSVDENYFVYCSLRGKVWLESCASKCCKLVRVKPASAV